MNNSKALFHDFVNQLTTNDSAEEVRSVAYRVFENLYGCSVADILADKPIPAAGDKSQKLLAIIQRLNSNEPLQYILDEEYFYGRKFRLNGSVLIPRPETEELVRAVIDSAKNKKNISILDVGTGSGCIAITLALELPGAKVLATDISDNALEAAQKNAMALHAPAVLFTKHDILQASLLPNEYDIIVSNPPYITREEKKDMHENVLHYEPHEALFVTGNDPLLFYNIITAKAVKALRLNGELFFEINAAFGEEVKHLLMGHGFTSTSIMKDLSGKDRFVKGILTSRDNLKS